MQNLGILGGTFNPIHWGHLLMAEAALDQAQLDRVLWVPTHHPPHRSLANLADAAHRFEMVNLAIAAHSSFSLSRVDLNRSGTSYAFDTLTDLQALYPNSNWYWIIGLDAFQSLPHWYRHQELAPQCCWLIAPRQTLEESSKTQMTEKCQQTAQQMADKGIKLRWQVLQMPLIEISASLIRQYCGDRRSIRYLVPDPVWEYINTHHLYRKGRDEG